MKVFFVICCFFLVYSSLQACKEERNLIPATASAEPGVILQRIPGITRFSGQLREGKVWLSWTVDQNEQADYFEIEKTTDNVHYTAAGMVFPGEKQGPEQYPFKENCTNSKTGYRIKLVLRNKQIIYSETIHLTSEK